MRFNKEGVMPRETIDDLNGSYSVKVGWSAEQGVQVGLAHPEGKSLYWVMLGQKKDNRAQLGRAMRFTLDKFRQDHPEDGDPSPRDEVEWYARMGEAILNCLDVETIVVFDSIWSDLDRSRANRLIRLLRRARDAAFGKDE